ncbi:MAG: 2-hydroxychromene-2-carboxylate isomerase [Polaromonas sp.]|uniref:2-hydroxychromene-2-carboxylate isomerase n=1 Tax=Polaromonas sp. TaxID=1869339 RepID=UPI00273110C0|nr:2-hydroxychromene-2-carboxylate isomerase [Polaromonas sp.]MDP1740783.1 2-hydroxychromene-2-carboxylate isomerase [Polaromonas sp.]MDP1954536.1 2-hydroxychromene-2-carboxylate isomerase [Polaromonas sp.]MDP3355973.1 2-hydroxychromene-2-carboxylate isomerase [Polaromonas sp.]MDP3753494.1 2-hydroxychromene-2-carboxylate isomerase [Polaromonas sp.]
MTAPPAPLHFYFDFISPFGYFASLRIEEIAARHGRRVDWHAMLLGVSVLKVMGLKPLLDTPLKGDYIRRDALRYMRRHGVQMQRKLDDPVMDPRAAGRAFHWVKQQHPELAARLAHSIYHAYWAEGRDLSSAEALASIALPDGLDSQRLQEGINSPEASPWLRSAVDASLKAGIFGSPTVVIDGEPFWGVQTLELAEEWLACGGW